MSGILVPNAAGRFVHAGLDDLQRRINREIDSRVYLTMGILEEQRGGVPTGRVGRRYEAWRLNEDGSNTRLGHWLLDEVEQIFGDLMVMKAGAEGRAPSVLDRIDKTNAEAEARLDTMLSDTIGEMSEHGARLWHDRNNPRNRFYMNGPKRRA